MPGPLRILFISPEVAPFVKTGGLGDVAAALPRELHGLGHEVRVVMPLLPRVHEQGQRLTTILPELGFDLGPRRIRCSVHEGALPGGCPVWFVRCPPLFDRKDLYGSAPDEHLRFAALAWASLLAASRLGFSPHIAHANDWTGGLIPLLLRTRFSADPLLQRTRTVFTIHNLGHQGTFDARVLPETGLGGSAHLFHQDELRAGRLGYLLTGLLYAHAITTVSPTYARQIQTPQHGVRLDSVLRARRDVLFGILNGIDEEEWDPRTDRHLPHNFGPEDLDAKEQVKQVLLHRSRLPYRPDVPVVGLCSRLVWQKGIDLCMEVLPALLNRRRFQLVVLGRGEPRYEQFFRALAAAHPRQVSYDSGFTEPKAHLLEGGCDLFLMPSRYEPCGLNQMYSLRYGTVPIVHRTGGLADTVWPYDRSTGRGTGFAFEHFDATGLAWALTTAISTFGSGTGHDRARWRSLQQAGMRLPLGWRHRVGRYVELYEKMSPELGQA